MAHLSAQGRNNVSSDLMRDVASLVAQQKAMERSCGFLPHGCRLFEVEKGWEGIMVGEDPFVAVVDTLLKLEAALRDSENKIIFIPLGARMTDADIEKICRRNAAVRTFFREVERS